MRLTPRDAALLQTLTSKVRMLTLTQIANTWWSGISPLLARNRVRILLKHDLLQFFDVSAHPMLELAAPLLTWKPTSPDPDYYSISYHLTSRWSPEYIPTRIFLASSRTLQQSGSRGKATIRTPDQATHDIHLAAVYLKLLKEHPEVAKYWVSEDEFASERVHQKLPDAVLKDGTGVVRLVVEFGGKYDAKRFRAFHEDCKARGLPYELW